MVKDTDGNSVLHTVYDFDSSGWLNRQRSYDFSENNQNDTPICGDNLDFSYLKDLYNNITKTTTNYCNGNQYQIVPYEIKVKMYNSRGLLTSHKRFNIIGTTSYISFREDLEYDDQGFNTKIQYFEGMGSAMKAAWYKIRERDENLFVTTEKIYDAMGDLIKNASDATRDCQVNDFCYAVTSYTYR